MTEKQQRDSALLGSIHPGLFDDVEVTDTPNFYGGARIDYTPRPMTQPHVYREPGGWNTVENGQITRLRMFQERAEALEAVGLSE